MLSDACSDYLASEDTIISAVRQLARELEHYAGPVFKYPDEIIRTLTEACESVMDYGDFASVEHLDRLATSVMRHLDAPWLYSDWRPMIVDTAEAASSGY
jgi:hypothetical protein